MIRTIALIVIIVTTLSAFLGCRNSAGNGDTTTADSLMTTAPTDHTPVPHGIDVSHHNDISWEMLKTYKHLRFMYAKATEGATFRDDKFEFHRQFARKHHLKFGGYHFLTTTSAVGDQFTNFKEVFGACDCLPMLDIEGRRIQRLDTLTLQGMLDEWIDSCQHTWHVKPLVYCSAKLRGRLDLRGCPWWVDGEVCRNACNVIADEPTGDYTIWQFSTFKDTTAVGQKLRKDGSLSGDSIDVNFFRPGLGLSNILMKTNQQQNIQK